MSIINFGIWGLGRIGNTHMRHFSSLTERYQPVAVCDVDATRANEMADAKQCQAYDQPQTFLNDSNMQLVIIATRSLDHAAHAKMALQAGKTVLLEKPIGVTEADYQTLKQANADFPGKLFFLHNHRFEPAFQAILEIVRSGKLGKVHTIKLRRHHQFRRRPDWQSLLAHGGGQLSCWGPHILDHAMQLINAPVKDVWSHLQRINTPGDADDHVKVILVGENDTLVDFEISDAVAIRGTFCTAYGDRGTLICADEKTIQLKYIDPDFELPQITASAEQPPTKGGFGHEESGGFPWQTETVNISTDVNMWDQVEIDIANHLYNAIRNDIPFPVANEDALEIVRITNVIKKQNSQFEWII
ncbi:MAG: oxidoreductase [Phycisphaeraceae bacterium]|nr:oxidoreductase [Phycisphaeraceae bacterium]